MATKFQTVRGMRDVYNSDQKYMDFVSDTARAVLEDAGYSRISTPVIEDADLFISGVGAGTGIVDTEMYSFKDQSGNKLALRAEGTVPVARAYIEHGMMSKPHPVKLYYIEPMFRYDRPQAGRYRQHTQFGAEVFGDGDSVTDAELITLLNRVYARLGLDDYTIEVNSIGLPQERTKYLKVLTDYYKRAGKLCEDCVKRMKNNPLRLLDCKREECGLKYKGNAPQIIDHLDKESRAHFENVLEFLDELEVPYDVNPFLVRGLSYYTRTVFEAVPQTEDKQQSAIGGGGRYDLLVGLLGGKHTAAAGFGAGIERIADLLQASGIEAPAEEVDVYVVQLGSAAKKASFKVLNLILNDGISARGATDKDSIKNQLGYASSIGAKFALIIGQKEVFDKTVIIRDMKSGAQDSWPLEKVTKELKKRLANG